jgi:hypothetical protein
VPDGPDDIATFAVSDQTAVGFGLEINSIVFAQDASSYAFDLEGVPDFTGGGIINNSSNLQSFEIGWVSYYINGYPYSISFYNSATAGELTQFTIEAAPGEDEFGGELIFWNSSTAGSAVINNLGGGPYYTSGASFTLFEDESSAENATIINEGGGLYGHGVSRFDNNSTAGNATIINNAR